MSHLVYGLHDRVIENLHTGNDDDFTPCDHRTFLNAEDGTLVSDALEYLMQQNWLSLYACLDCAMKRKVDPISGSVSFWCSRHTQPYTICLMYVFKGQHVRHFAGLEFDHILVAPSAIERINAN